MDQQINSSVMYGGEPVIGLASSKGFGNVFALWWTANLSEAIIEYCEGKKLAQSLWTSD